MRGSLAQNIFAKHRDQIGPRQQILDGPNTRIARLQYIATLHAHNQTNTAGADALGTTDTGHEVFGNVDFQHAHFQAPYTLLLRGDRAPGSLYSAIGIFYVAMACARSRFVAATTKTSHNRLLIESQLTNSRASRSARVCALPHAPTGKRECLPFSSPERSARTAPAQDGGDYRQSIPAVLFQVRP